MCAPSARRQSAVADTSSDGLCITMSVGASASAAHTRYLCASDLDDGARTVPDRFEGVIFTFIFRVSSYSTADETEELAFIQRQNPALPDLLYHNVIYKLTVPLFVVQHYTAELLRRIVRPSCVSERYDRAADRLRRFFAAQSPCRGRPCGNCTPRRNGSTVMYGKIRKALYRMRCGMS